LVKISFPPWAPPNFNFFPHLIFWVNFNPGLKGTTSPHYLRPPKGFSYFGPHPSLGDLNLGVPSFPPHKKVPLWGVLPLGIGGPHLLGPFLGITFTTLWPWGLPGGFLSVGNRAPKFFYIFLSEEFPFLILGGFPPLL